MDHEEPMPTVGRHNGRVTYDDFLLFPDDGRRHEIIDGVHYVTPSPNTRHQELVGRLHLAIGMFLRASPAHGRVFLAPFDVVFSFYDIVEPDLLFIAGDQADILTDTNVQGAPALVVEVLSKGTRRRDEETKRQLFARGGVREYWLVDPERDLLTVYRRAGDGTFARVSDLAAAADVELTTPLLPGFALSLTEFFLR